MQVLAAPETRCITLTITEGGYKFDRGTGASDGGGVFSYVVEALDRRRKSDLRPFTVLSCDNLAHNGDIARDVFLAFADARDPSLAAWIKHNVAFPNCMVDRITPQTTDADRADIRDRIRH